IFLLVGLVPQIARSGGQPPPGGATPAGAVGAAAATTPEWVLFWFSLALCGMGAVEPPTWTTAQELGGRRGATAAGICNTGGNAGGIIAPVVTPLVATRFGWGWAI